jgi:hypothetical protein
LAHRVKGRATFLVDLTRGAENQVEEMRIEIRVATGDSAAIRVVKEATAVSAGLARIGVVAVTAHREGARRAELKADRRGAIDHEPVVPSDWGMDRGHCGRDVQRKERGAHPESAPRDHRS